MVRLRAFGATLGLTAAVALVTPASAGVGEVPGSSLGKSHGLKYAGGSNEFVLGGLFIATGCSGEPPIVGGGMHGTGPDEESHVNYSRPLDDGDKGTTPDDLWAGEAAGQNNIEKRLDVFAICRKAGAGPLSFETGTGPELDPGEVGTARATCPGGTTVLGGGPLVFTANVPISRPFDGDDRRSVPDNGWQVRVRHLGAGAEEIEVAAICLDKDKGDVSYEERSATTPNAGSRTLRASCPADSAVAAGGYALQGNASLSFIHATLPQDSGADGNDVPDDRWSATALNGNPDPKQLTVYAVCLS